MHRHSFASCMVRDVHSRSQSLRGKTGKLLQQSLGSNEGTRTTFTV